MTLRDANRTGADDARTIDGEHRIQLSLVDALGEAIAAGEATADLGEMLDRCRDYTRLHFLSEELLMRRHGYPGHGAHMHEHHRLLDDFDAIEQACAGGNAESALGAVNALRVRLLTHLQSHDAELSRYMAGDREPWRTTGKTF